MRGIVNANYAGVVSRQVRGPSGAEISVEAIVDSGFTSSLTLAVSMVASLDLVRKSVSKATLADGSVRRFDVYEAEVLWDGAWRKIAVFSLGNEVLLGMHLMAGHELRITVVPGGAVEITPLP